jgi:hypothetical protein
MNWIKIKVKYDALNYYLSVHILYASKLSHKLVVTDANAPWKTNSKTVELLWTHCTFYSWFSLVWFGLFVHPFSQTCNIGYVNYRLQFIYYNTTCNIWTSTQYNIINNNTKLKDQLKVEFETTSRYMCIYINIPKS